MELVLRAAESLTQFGEDCEVVERERDECWVIYRDEWEQEGEDNEAVEYVNPFNYLVIQLHRQMQINTQYRILLVNSRGRGPGLNLESWLVAKNEL